VEVQGLAHLRETAPEQAAQLLSNTPIDEHPFAALNTAFLDDGALIRAPRGVFDERAVHLVVVAGAYPDPRVSHPRVLVVAEPKSHLTLVLDYLNEGDGPGFTNAVTELHLAEDAEVQLVIVQRERAQHFHIGGVFVHQERGSRFSCHTLSLGGTLVRNDLSVQLAGEGAISNLQGLFVARESAVADNHTRVDHAVPHCESRELYKGIIGEGGRGIFHGHVIVRPDAQQTLAEQRNANLLLGEKAEIDTRPQLEINADDVRCSHGSTIGQLDAEALFYLQSRGIEKNAAREILTRAFADEILSALPIPDLRESLEPFVAAELAGLRGS
jgi:Fe-S cluster assembly protein SufD